MSLRTRSFAAALAACIAGSAASGPPAAGDGEPARWAAKTERAAELRPGAPTEGLAPVTVDALSCVAPCSIGTVSALHPYYDVFMACGNGAFTARTGPSHSVTLAAGAAQNVIFGGAGGAPGTSDITFFVHETGTQYTNPGGGRACAFDPPDTVAEPASTGLEQEWSATPAIGMNLTFREEIVAFGTTEADSGVRLTLSVTNEASSVLSATVGMRWQIDYQNAGDDGPLFAAVTCDPPSTDRELFGEHELTPAEIKDFYRIQNNSGFPIFSNVTSTTPLTGIPNTARPDRLIFASWGSVVGSAWGYLANEGNPAVDFDSAVLYYFGYQAADAPVLRPGQSITRSAVIFTSPALVDCGSFVPGCAPSISGLPPDRTICSGQTTTLDGSGLDLTNCDGVVQHEWSDPGGLIAIVPVVDVSPTADTEYLLTASCTTDAGCFSEHRVLVTVESAPELDPAAGEDADPCNAGLLLSWPPARFQDPASPGSYHVYRSEVSCADALAGPPVALGLTMESWFDRSTLPGVDYYYVIEAEEPRPAAACTPTGPLNGGVVAQACVGPVRDALDPGAPEVLGIVLFASHLGDEIALSWAGSRPLLSNEAFHLLKTWEEPTNAFVHANPVGDRSLGFIETDRSSPLQFFDLRVAACGGLSEDEFPPSR